MYYPFDNDLKDKKYYRFDNDLGVFVIGVLNKVVGV